MPRDTGQAQRSLKATNLFLFNIYFGESEMSSSITTAFIQQYRAKVELLAQQMGSKLSGAVDYNSGYVGKAVSLVEQFAPVEAIVRVGRHGQTPMGNAGQDRRWVRPVDYEVPAELFDTVDKLRMIIDPLNPYAQSQALAIGRAKDRAIIDAFFGPSINGEDGTTTQAFNTSGVMTLNGSMIVSKNTGGANTGLNVSKLIKAKTNFMRQNVDLDMESLFLAITADEHEKLLGEIQIVSTDYNSRPVLVDGKLQSFLGINFIHTELIPAPVANTRKLPIWCKSGVHLAEWAGLNVDIGQRRDLRNSWQVYTTATFNATRLREDKVGQIEVHVA